MSPNAGGGVAGSLPRSIAVHRSPNKLWRSNSIINVWRGSNPPSPSWPLSYYFFLFCSRYSLKAGEKGVGAKKIRRQERRQKRRHSQLASRLFQYSFTHPCSGSLASFEKKEFQRGLTRDWNNGSDKDDCSSFCNHMANFTPFLLSHKQQPDNIYNYSMYKTSSKKRYIIFWAIFKSFLPRSM